MIKLDFKNEFDTILTCMVLVWNEFIENQKTQQLLRLFYEGPGPIDHESNPFWYAFKFKVN